MPHTVSVFVDIYNGLKSSRAIPLTTFFFKIAVTILVSLSFYVRFRTSLSIPTKDPAGILMEISYCRSLWESRRLSYGGFSNP